MSERSEDSSIHPPAKLGAILKWVLPDDEAGRCVAADLKEEFFRRARSRGARAAKTWYWREALAVATHSAWDQLVGAFSQKIKRSPRGDSAMSKIGADLRFAARTLGRSRGFAFIATVTLAIGIGANTAIYSVVDGVLLNPLPYPDAHRLVGIWHPAPALGFDRLGISSGIYLQYLEDNTVFDELAVYQPAQVNLTGEGDPAGRPARGIGRT